MRKFTFLTLFLLIFIGFPSASIAVPSIGEMANNIAVPTEFLTRLALLACYAIGAALVFASLAQYKIHRQSPKLVPLATPIVLLILGIICIFIPYGSQLFGDSFSAVERAKEEGRYKKGTTLPLPDMPKQEPRLPVPSRQAPDEVPAPAPVPDVTPQDTTPPTGSSSGGHWTEDPRYNQ